MATMLKDSFRLLPAYFLRFWRERRTYKTQLVLMAITSIISFVQFGFMGIFLSSGGSFPSLGAYGGDIIAFMITGSVGSSMLLLIMNAPKGIIQEEQQLGTLEISMVSAVGINVIMTTRIIVNLLSTVFTSSVMVATFFWVFKVDANVNLLALLLSALVGFATMLTIGICAAGYILNSKSGEPFTWVVTTFMALLSGVLFPIEILPDWLQHAALKLPTTVIMKSLRMSCMVGADLTTILDELIPALIFVVVMMPFSLWLFLWGLREARAKGTIGFY